MLLLCVAAVRSAPPIEVAGPLPFEACASTQAPLGSPVHSLTTANRIDWPVGACFWMTLLLRAGLLAAVPVGPATHETFLNDHDACGAVVIAPAQWVRCTAQLRRMGQANWVPLVFFLGVARCEPIRTAWYGGRKLCAYLGRMPQ
jgi:hypothetical protein